MAGSRGIGVVAGAISLPFDRVVMARRAEWFGRERGRVLGIVAYCLLAAGLIGGVAIRLAGG